MSSDPSQPQVDLEQLTQLFEEGIAFNRYLGLKLEALGRGNMTARLPYRPDFLGDPQRPALHGGVISSLIDTVGGGAVYSLTSPGDRLATIDLRVDYLLPGRAEDLVAEAKVIRVGNRVGVSSIEVFHPSQPDTPIAVGKGVYTIKRA